MYDVCSQRANDKYVSCIDPKLSKLQYLSSFLSLLLKDEDTYWKAELTSEQKKQDLRGIKR